MRLCEIDGCGRKHKARGKCTRHFSQTHYKDHQPAYMERQRVRRSTPEGREQKRAWARMKYLPMSEVLARSGETEYFVRKSISLGHLRRKRGTGRLLISEDSFNRWMGHTEFTPTDEEVGLMEAFKEAALRDPVYLTEVLWDARDYLDNVTDS